MQILMSILSLLVMLAIAGAFIYGGYLLLNKLIDKKIGANEGDKSVRGQGLKLPQNSLFSRILVGLVLIMVSLIPLSFVEGLISERGRLYDEVANRMAGEWSGLQSISGPILTVPYEHTETVSEQITDPKTGDVRTQVKQFTNTRYLTILPDQLSIESSLETKELKRGIYAVPIYTSMNSFKGTFKWPDLSVLNHAPEKFLWDRAIVTILIKESKGMESGSNAQWNNSSLVLEPGNGFSTAGMSNQGVHARLKIDESFKVQPASFEFIFNLRGSRGVLFSPTGKDTTINLSANWGDPSFEGVLLPSVRDIKQDSFKAEWNVSYLSRSFSQMAGLTGAELNLFLEQINTFSLGVNLFNSINLYTLLDRTVKYGIMFISLTFFSIFIVEFASGARLHWIQHLIIGAALSMFYLCVLAFSEHIPFGFGYAIGMALITLIISGYAWIAMGKMLYGLTLGGVIVALYSVLYSILQMEDYALLIGTLLLLLFLVLGMYVTRNMGQKSNDQEMNA